MDPQTTRGATTATGSGLFDRPGTSARRVGTSSERSCAAASDRFAGAGSEAGTAGIAGSTSEADRRAGGESREELDGFALEAKAIADTCYAMARRFHRGGRLFAFGTGASVADAHHVAVEFVQPVITAKRALPAIALTGDGSMAPVDPAAPPTEVFGHQLRLLAGHDDIALGISTQRPDAAVVQGLVAARSLGMLTVALSGGLGDVANLRLDVHHQLVVASDDALTARELQMTTYHLLWELIHVFFEQSALLVR